LDGPFLSDGQRWADRFGPQPVPDSLRPERFRRSVHEVGHALACVLAGVKVEYVHILSGQSGIVTTHGLCKYDYDVDGHLAADPMGWSRRLLIAHLGGIIADRECLRRNGQSAGLHHEYSWLGDEVAISKRLEVLATEDTDRARIRQVAESLPSEKVIAHWTELERAAELVTERLAISGEMVMECFGQTEPIDLSQLGGL